MTATQSVRVRSLHRSKELHDATSSVLAGGVGSNDRGNVYPHPIFIERGTGSHLIDIDGNEYIDYLLGYGPLVLGHAHPGIVAAVTRQMSRGSMFGAGHALELAAAELLVDLMPSFDMVRFSQSGTEAVLTAVRLARAATGRRLVIKFEGQYHGWLDQLAVSYAPSAGAAGPADAPTTQRMSEGQAESVLDDVIVLQWNDLAAVADVFARRSQEIAAILTEPVMCNYGVIEPAHGYLEGLRAICDTYGSVLIFDEVQTGFRVGLRGAQGEFGVTPDLTTLGKAVSGGLPVSVVGGKQAIMELIADRRVFHAGTYNTNPLCLSAVPVVVAELSRPGVYAEMERLSSRLRSGLADVLAPIGGYVQGTNTLFGVGFGEGPGRNMRGRWADDVDKIMAFKRELRLRGVYTKPTPRDVWYVSTAHTDADVDRTLETAALIASMAEASAVH